MSDRVELAARIRAVLADRADVSEQHTIGGGLGFMVDGSLCIAATERGLTVRVGSVTRRAALDEPHVGPLVVGARQPKAFVVVDHEGIADDEALLTWIERGLAFVASL